jgi:hypothetical protein
MAERLYRVKLYGYTGDNPEAFARSLGALVKRDPKEVLEMLKHPPIVLKEGLPKDRADTIVEAVNILKGLCLSEPMRAAPEDDAMARLAELTMMRDAQGDTIKDDAWAFFSKRRTAIIVGVIIFLFVLLISWPFLKRSGSIRARNVQVNQNEAKESRGSLSTGAKNLANEEYLYEQPYLEWSQYELKKEHAALNESLKDMRIELQLHQRDLNRLKSRFNAQSEHVRSRMQKLGQLRWRMKVAAQEMEMIKEALVTKKRMNRRQ